MDISYLTFNGIPESPFLEGILNLHGAIFGISVDLIDKMKDKPNLLVNIAVYNSKVIGFKIGYELDENTFYSWLGGVNPDYRNYGIASTLMQEQHQFLKEHGYKVVQTKTMNRWRNMLILNIKNGFDVVETYIDRNGLHKIILEKYLN